MKRVWLKTLVNVALAAGVCVVLLAACGGDSPQTLIKSAKDYLAKGDSSAALIQLRNALQKTPDDPEARYLLGTALNERHDSAGAVKELRMALQLGYPADAALPALASALVADGDAAELVTEFGYITLGSSDAQAAFKTTIGNALLSLDKPKEAEASFNAALAAKADYADALLGIAIVRAGSGDIDGSRKIIDAVLAQPHPPPEASLLKARLLVAEGQTDSATALLTKALEAKPDYLQAHYLLASLLIGKGDLEQATAQLGAIRKISKLDRQAYYFEALIASRRGDLPAAREAVQQVLKGGVEYAPGLLLAGEIEFRAKQYNQALDYLRRAVNRAPDSLYAQRLLAATYLRLGSPAHALEVVQPALNRGTSDPQLMTVAGEAYLAIGDIPKAAQYFAQTTALDPKNAAARTRLGQVRFAEGDNEGAIRDLEAASAMDPNVSAADLALIANLLRQKQLDQALAAVGQLDKKQPNSPLVQNLRGIVYLSKRDIGAARESFERALQIQPNYLPAIGNLAQLDRIEKKPDLARKRYDAVLEKDPKNEQALLGLTSLLQSLGADPNEIESLLKKAVTANPQSINVRVALVTFYAQRGDGKQALLAAQEANAALSNDPRTLELLGQVQQATGDATLAVGTFSKLVAAQPDALGPLLHLAGALVAVKDYDKAIEKMREAQKINPDRFETNRQLAIVYSLAGHSEQALLEIKAIQQRQPADMRGYQLEGDFWGGQQKWQEAEAAFRAAQKHAPDDGMVAVKLYATMANAGKGAAASATADKWLQDHPKDVVLRGYLGERALQKQDYKAAARYYQAAVAQQPDNVMFLNNLAWVAGELGDPKALSYAEKASTLAPTNASILDTLGMLLVKKGDVTQGLEKLQKAAQLAPNQAEIRLHLAKTLIKAGDKTAARKELEVLAQASNQAAGKSATDAKGTGAEEQQSLQASIAKTPPLSCGPDCAAEVAALLKTL
ncbi:MAG TPA: XrtA/PEP-CTERM system TPR-repeat protein PrsT [Casimicrobiaceae bacterium]|nr:XrtA/PEP-CTERM system TPR-repeat protein PrsT [Casimicrobiaceae bacterium]